MTRTQKRIRALMILAGIIGLTVILCGHGKKQPAENWETYTIERGDTLWSISKQFAPASSDIRDYIYLLQEKNNIGAGLQAGQTIDVLRYEK